jgi:hypothetical protein
MIRFGQQGDREGKRSLTLYASPENALAVRMADRSGTLNPSERTNVGGLTQTTFALSGSPRPAARDMTVIISGV